MKIEIEVSDVMLQRLEYVARARNVTVETLAHACVEDWLNIEYAAADLQRGLAS